MADMLKANELTGIVGRSEMDKLEKIYGERWVNYRKRYERASNLDCDDFPIQLDIELNSSCNLRCPMCPISAESPVGKGKKNWFPFDRYKEIIDVGVRNGLCAVKLNYLNEPLIRKDVTVFIEYAIKSGVLDVYLSTNGILMDQKYSEKIVNSGLTRIQVSIDAVSEDVYDKMRPGGDFETVIENVKGLIDVRNKMNSVTPLIRVNFVRTEINEQQLDDFIEYWKDKVDMVGIQEFVEPTKSSSSVTSNTSVDKLQSNFRCSFPFKQLVITNEMDVLPCCTFWGEELTLGTLEDASQLSDYWGCEAISELRKIHHDGEYYKIPQCKKCLEGSG